MSAQGVNIAAYMQDQVASGTRGLSFRAAITSVVGELSYVQRYDPGAEIEGPYPHLSSYTPTAGHEVKVDALGDGFIVVARIVR